MGTNYYWYPHPKRQVRTHIGKSSFGWTFSFHGTDVIKSAKQWFTKLKTGIIKDEYGETMPLAEFKALVKRKTKEKNNHAAQYPLENCWLDKEGHSFSDGEFS